MNLVSSAQTEHLPPAGNGATPLDTGTILDNLEAFREIAESLRGVSQVGAICEQVVSVLKARLSLETCSIMLLDPSTSLLVNVAGTAPRSGKAEPTPTRRRRFKLGEGVAGTVAQSGEPVVIADVREDERFDTGNRSSSVRSLMCLPLTGDRQSLGVLNLSHTSVGFFGEAQRTVFGILATMLGRILEEARLSQELAQLNQGLEQQVAQRTEEIRASHAYLEQILACASDIILTVDWRGRITFANARVQELGVTPEALRGQPFTTLLQDDRLPTPLAHALSGETSLNVELVLHGQDGVALESYCSFAPMVDPDSDAPACLVLVRDMTANKRLEQQVRQMDKLTSLGTLVAGIAHEINNKLVPILVYSELLQRSELAENELKMVETVHRSATGARHIMDSLLRFSRQEPARKVSQSLNEVVEEMLDIAGFRAAGTSVEVTHELAAGLPACLMDRHQIGQVVVNLLNNAHDALSGQAQGTIHITTQQVGDRLQMTVTDNGPGMSSQVQSRIFDPFFTTKGVGEGTGLGLSLCFGMIQEHGGKIEVESRPGHTCFTVTLPLDGGGQVPTSVEPSESPGLGSVLIASGDPALIEVVAQLLPQPQQVVRAADGEQVVNDLAQTPMDLCILDLPLPGGDPDTLLARLSDSAPHMVVLVEASEEGNGQFGGAQVVTKPVAAAALQEAVQRAMTHTRADG